MEKMNPYTLLIKGETVDTTLENHLVAFPHKSEFTPDPAIIIQVLRDLKMYAHMLHILFIAKSYRTEKKKKTTPRNVQMNK